MKEFFLISCFILIILLSNGCSKHSNTIKNGVDYSESNKLSMTYDKFSGYKEVTITVKEEQPIIVTADITTISGSLSAYILRNDTDEEDYRYKGNELKDSDFTVTLTEAGDYTLHVDAKKHKGNFTFSW